MDEILTFEEVTEYLKLSKSKLYGLAQQRKIPVSKVGRTWRFRKASIDAWLERQERHARQF